MTQTTLRTVTLETVANYREAAGHRLLAIMNRNLDRGTSRLAPQLAAALRRTSNTVGNVAAKGIDSISAQTERVIELGSAGVSARIGRVADLVQAIENRYVATGLQTAARFSLTGAQAALTLSEKLAAGADKLAAVVGGRHARGTQAVARAKTAVKAARRAATPAKPRVANANMNMAKRIKAAPAKRSAQPVVKAKAPRRAAPKLKQTAAQA